MKNVDEKRAAEFEQMLANDKAKLEAYEHDTDESGNAEYLKNIPFAAFLPVSTIVEWNKYCILNDKHKREQLVKAHKKVNNAFKEYKKNLYGRSHEELE